MHSLDDFHENTRGKLPQPVFTPCTLNRVVRDLLENALPLIWIEGELSNVARPASGHLYFTLKDSLAQIRCAMFKPKSLGLRFRLADGAKVLCRARVGLYEPRGEFQLVMEHMEPAGEGALQREFERLKAQLNAEGLFAQDRKRALPRFARRVGVITSATGAAIRDVLSVISRRWPLVELDVLPVPVQGHQAPSAIVSMLRKASACGRYDVLLLTRGGGSLEALWAFNDEQVARAVHASAVPVISAVGHEIDFSISDFVADLRAPTPSAAAELLVPDILTQSKHLQQLRQRLGAIHERGRQVRMQRIDHLLARLQAQHPQARLARDRQRLQPLYRRLLACRLARHTSQVVRLDRTYTRLLALDPHRRIALLRRRLDLNVLRLRQAAQHKLHCERLNLQQVTRTMHAVSPLATLERGYAIVVDAHGKVVRSAREVAVDAPLQAKLADGALALRVTGKLE